MNTIFEVMGTHPLLTNRRFYNLTPNEQVMCIIMHETKPLMCLPTLEFYKSIQILIFVCEEIKYKKSKIKNTVMTNTYKQVVVKYLQLSIMMIDNISNVSQKLQLIDLLFYFLIQENVFMKNASAKFIETVKMKLEDFHKEGIVPNSNLYHLLLFQKEIPSVSHKKYFNYFVEEELMKYVWHPSRFNTWRYLDDCF